MALTKITSNMASLDTLTANNGVLELDDNGTHNGIINVPASLSINIDSDNGATGESFTISKDKTGINDTDPLFRVKEDGNVSVGIASAFGTTSNRTQLTVNGTSSAGVNVGTGGSQKGYMFTDGNSLAISTIGTIPLKLGINDQNKTIQIDADGDLLIGQTSNTTNAKVNIGASNGVPLTIGSDQYGGSGTVTFFTESIEGKTASNTHTITISFTSQSSRWATHLAEIHFAGSRDNATTVLCGRALYSFATLTGFANIGEVEDIGTNVSMSANDSGMDLVITVSASTVATYQVMVKVISSFGNARPYAISVT